MTRLIIQCSLSPSANMVNGKIYIISGLNAPGGWCDIVQEYDPINDTLKELQKIPVKRSSFSTVELNGKILAIGGFTNQTTPTSSVEEYTPEGWPFAVFPQSKQPKTWGRIKGNDIHLQIMFCISMLNV